MQFICDVHISFKVVKFLVSKGYSAIHVNDLPDKWYTKDDDISKYADANNLILITKDADFRNSYFIKKTPKKLIKVNLGNISNTTLVDILSEILDIIEKVNLLPHFLIEIEKNYYNLVTE
jgi:predicted nuclease of predicted toxin-antitoxin system